MEPRRTTANKAKIPCSKPVHLARCAWKPGHDSAHFQKKKTSEERFQEQSTSTPVDAPTRHRTKHSRSGKKCDVRRALIRFCLFECTVPRRSRAPLVNEAVLMAWWTSNRAMSNERLRQYSCHVLLTRQPQCTYSIQLTQTYLSWALSLRVH